MIPKEDFACPRCDYKTHHKATMRNHLYKRQTPCPATKEAFKDMVLQMLQNKK